MAKAPELLADFSAQELPNWFLGERQGLTIAPLTIEPVRFEREGRQRDIESMRNRL